MCILQSDLFYVSPVEGKGMGMIAAKNIPKGTRLFVEQPLFKAPNDATIIENSVKEKTQEEQAAFHDLFNAHVESMGPYLGPFYSNALTVNDNQGGLFLLGSRMNHDCSPNVKHTWNDTLDGVTVHAVRDIQKGEEILTTYIDLQKPKGERRKLLQAHFGFLCLCSACSMTGTPAKHSDQRRKELAYYDRRIAKMAVTNPRGALRALRHRILLAHQERLFGRLDIVSYLDAARLCIIHGDFNRAKVFLQRGLEVLRVCEGEDSPKFKKLIPFVDDIKSHPLAEGVYEMPLVMDEEFSDAEDQLWGCVLEEDEYSD
ncbi:histone lysine methyltransferase Set5 [Schizosaccharomyces japonicus yFS275]|uniref:Histone lysine methyltransferase Set5 n=1 Tax=Schizosaccharomyces japonicus (strain yFS275 / FY16936) TaxID=402676 RepID=B6K4R8_SCHJY|nr:histone lysine methyltransferase Set5 [Schizosaccharomyces japonicus yFS275]EEB08475.1 histone lysine methyltransferase Set5 [Schizosaccharomyces japonicus yFS275]